LIWNDLKVKDAFRRRPLFWSALFLCALIASQRYFFPDLFQSRLPRLDTPLYLGGVISSEIEEKETLYGERRTLFILQAKRLFLEDGRSKPASGLVKVSARDLSKDLRYGDEIVLEGEMRQPRVRRNPGGFDQKAYLKRLGVERLFYTKKDPECKVLRRGRGNPVIAWALASRNVLAGLLDKRLDPESAGFMKALLLGEKSGLEEEVKTLFMNTGTMHLLAVSGFNVGFIILAVYFLLKAFPVTPRVRLIAALIAVWTYCFIVGWQAPVVRASVMASVMILASILGRKTDPLNSLGAAAIVVLAINPGELFGVGFQLSFLAVLGILVLVPIFFRKPDLFPNETLSLGEKAVFYVKELFWISFVCQIVTLPVTVQNFYIVTPLSVLSNMVLVPIAFVLFMAGIFFLAAGTWMPEMFSLIPDAIGALMTFALRFLRLMDALPGSVYIAGVLDAWIWAALVCGVVYFCFTRKLRGAVTRAVCLVIFIAAILGAQELSRFAGRTFRMTVLDVGQGDAIFFEFPKGGNLLVDAGRGGDGDAGRFVTVPFLRSKGIRRLDALLISHPQEDHLGGALTLVKEYPPRILYESGREHTTQLYRIWRKSVDEKNIPYRWIGKDARIGSFKDVTIDVLNPDLSEPAKKELNNESLVLLVTYGATRFLLTGDIEDSVMRRLALSGRDLKADVLKVPHHGSRMEEGGRLFIEKVRPGASIISCGDRNPFGHPAPRTLGALESVPGNAIYRTDRHGAVLVTSDGVSVKASGFLS
jgi:competence protein ComEC